MTFTSKYELNQPVGYTSSGTKKVSIIIGVLFSEDGTLYEIDSGEFLEESRIETVYVPKNTQEFIQETSGVEIKKDDSDLEVGGVGYV